MNLSVIIPVAVVAIVAGAAIAWQAVQPAAPAKQAPEGKTDAAAPAEKADPYVLNHTMKLIDGTTDKNLKDYEGKVVVIVNVASKCGYTPQYKGLEALYREYKDKGLVVLGFPANDFEQEKGTNAEIQQFCSSKFDVTFPMFAKVVVTGENATPLYKQLTRLNDGKAVSWNFNKFLVGKDGKFMAHYETRMKPDDEVFVKAIREALGIKADAGAASPQKPLPDKPATPAKK